MSKECGHFNCFGCKKKTIVNEKTGETEIVGVCRVLSDTGWIQKREAKAKPTSITKTAQGEEYQAKIPRKYACPFFKTMEQNEKQKAEAMLKYKARTGLDHYVDPNSGMEAKDDA